MRRFYSPPENFIENTVWLNLDETRHLRDVLRLREGEKIQVFNGEDREFLCEIEKIEKQKTLLKILEEISPAVPESNLNLTLAVALLKGEKFDLIVQKAVELGVSKLIPLTTKRADVRIKDLKEAEKRLERWRKIALEACKQCGRARLTQIETPVDFGRFVEKSDGEKILFAERNGERFSAIKPNEKMTIVIGSEGGWDDSEINLAKANDFLIVTLDGRILRAETAAIAISALVQHRFGDFN